MNRSRWATRWLVGVVVGSLLAACSSGTPRAQISASSSAIPATSTTATTAGSGVVGEAGVHLEAGELTFSAGPGVAPVGERLVVTPTELPDLPDELGEPLPGLAFSVAFSDGAQPQAPVTVSAAVPDAATQDIESDLPDEPLVFLTRSSASDPWIGAPVTVSAGVATVELSHFSDGFFARAKRPGLVQAITDFLKLTYPAPECAGKSATVGDRVFTAASDHPDLFHPCVEVAAKGTLTASIHNNSPNVWLVRGFSSVATPLPRPASPDPVQAIVGLAHDADPSAPDNEVVLAAGSHVSFELAPEATETRLDLQVSAAYGLLGVLWAGVLTWLGPAGASVEWQTIIEAGTCLSDAMQLGESTAVDARWVAGNLPGLLGCASAYFKSIGKLSPKIEMALAIASSLASLLAAQIYGLYAAATTDGGNSSVHVTSELRSESSGGGWPTSRQDAAAGLHVWLGAANAWGEVSIGFPKWVSCSGAVCLAGDGVKVSVIRKGSTGYFEAATFPESADAKQSLRSLGLKASLIDSLLSPAP